MIKSLLKNHGIVRERNGESPTDYHSHWVCVHAGKNEKAVQCIWFLNGELSANTA